MLTKSGAKLLDFGLAKLKPAGSDAGVSAMPTQTAGLTGKGALLGTLQYMAPEQLEGREADARTDIFAFGSVIYEMVTGTRAFRGASQASLIGAILKDQPVAVSSLLPITPRALDRLVAACLTKDPDERWQSAGDLRRELTWVKEQPAETASHAPPARHLVWLPWVIALIAFGVALAAFLRPDPTVVQRPSEFLVSLEANRIPVPSPDGRYLVFLGAGLDEDSMLWIRALESPDARPLTGTEGATQVVWSPDGEWIGFFTGGRLRKIRPDGGPPETIAELRGFQNADWGSQGDIVYRPSNREPLYAIHETGGLPRQVTWLNEALTENSHRGPDFLPDGRRFLFTSRCAERDNNALYVASLDSPEVHRLMPAQAPVSYVPPRADRPGTLFYYIEGALVARPFDTDHETFVGEPTVVTEDVSYIPASISAGFRVSSDGSLIIVRPAGGLEAQLAWFRRDGQEIGTLGAPGRPGQPRISPNGEGVLFEAPDPQNGNRDVWYTEFSRGITTSLTTHIANDWDAVWSPDGGRILFGSDRDGGPRLSPYLKTSLDPGVNENRIPDLEYGAPQDWSRDGQWISYVRAQDIWVASLSSDVKTFPFLATPAFEANGLFSPDGRWIAYASNETGRWEVHLRPFAGGPASTEGRIQLSNNGGDFPVWGPDGHELFYMSEDGGMYVVDTAGLGGQESVSLPIRLFQVCPNTTPITLPAVGQPYNTPYDTLDGQRFLISCRDTAAGQFRVLLDWAPPE